MEAEAGKPNESSSSALEIAKDSLSRTLATGPASKADMDEEAEAQRHQRAHLMNHSESLPLRGRFGRAQPADGLSSYQLRIGRKAPTLQRSARQETSDGFYIG